MSDNKILECISEINLYLKELKTRPDFYAYTELKYGECTRSLTLYNDYEDYLEELLYELKEASAFLTSRE